LWIYLISCYGNAVSYTRLETTIKDNYKVHHVVIIMIRKHILF